MQDDSGKGEETRVVRVKDVVARVNAAADVLEARTAVRKEEGLEGRKKAGLWLRGRS